MSAFGSYNKRRKKREGGGGGKGKGTREGRETEDDADNNAQQKAEGKVLSITAQAYTSHGLGSEGQGPHYLHPCRALGAGAPTMVMTGTSRGSQAAGPRLRP